MNFFKNLLLPLVLLCSSAVPMLAQDLYPVESGPFSTMSNSVDVATTQARLSIPVFSKNGRGIPFSFVLSVNNATYAIESGYVSGCNGGSHLLCWQEFIGGISTNPTRAIVPVGYSIGVITYNFGIVTLPCNGGNISGYSNVVYIDSRGSRHIFLSGSQAVFPPNTCGQPTTKNMVITDGSGLTWKADTSVPNFG